MKGPPNDQLHSAFVTIAGSIASNGITIPATIRSTSIQFDRTGAFTPDATNGNDLLGGGAANDRSNGGKDNLSILVEDGSRSEIAQADNFLS